MFRDLMLWWLTTGVYCVENDKRSTCIRSHSTGPERWAGLCFCSLLFCSHVCQPWWYSERCWATRAEKTNVYFTATVLAPWGVNICDLNETWASSGAEKGIMSALYLFILICHYNISTDSSGLSLVWCCTAVFRDNYVLAVFTICDCFVAGAVWEALIVQVSLQCHQHLHDFPPVVDSKVFTTFCKTCL